MFWVFCVVAVLAGLAFTAGAGMRSNSDASALRGVGTLLGALAAILLFISSLTVVGSREVGIVTAFGKYQSTEGPGWHFTQPWSSVETFTTRVQSLDRKGTKVTLLADAAAGSSASDQDLSVPGGSGTVKATIRWQIDGEKRAENLWRGYKNFDTVKDRLVGPESDTSIQEVFGAQTATDARDGKNRRKLGKAVADNLQASLGGDGIKVLSVTITDVDLDEATEKRLSALAASSARLVQQRIDTQVAEEGARTNAARQGKRSIEQAQTDRCLDIVAEAVKSKAPLPATFDCDPGSNTSAVVTTR